MHEQTTRRLRRTVAGVGFLMGLLGSIAGVAFANHQFPDVPNSQPHHNSIGRLVDAGCATGFDDGTFRPKNRITRGQASRQIVRCASRVDASNDFSANAADNTEVVPASVDIRNLATTGVGGYVSVHGIVHASETATNCPCTVSMRILNDTTNESSPLRSVGFDTVTQANNAMGQVTWTRVFPLPPGAQHNYDLVASGFSAGDTHIVLDGTLTATYHPMGGAGITIG